MNDPKLSRWRVGNKSDGLALIGKILANRHDGLWCIADVNKHLPADEAEAIRTLIAMAPALYQELLDRYTQTRCGCGHPACGRCRDDKVTESVLARARGENTHD